MIRINLLPTRQARKKEQGIQQLALLGAVVLLAIGVNWWWASSLDSTLQSRNRQVSKLKQDITQLETIIGEITNITKDKKALEEKLAVLERLRKGRTGPVKMLDALVTLTPERVWFTSMEEKGGSLVLKGEAVSNEDLADLMKEMKKNPFFREPSLKRSVQRDSRGAGMRIIEFELSCGINYSA